MYKVFVNEKKLSISNHAADAGKNLHYEGPATLEIAVDQLANTSCPELNVYGENIEEIWDNFTHLFKLVKAAGGVVKNLDGNILFIHRLGKWDMPKGKIEKGESPEQAALREVEEETALKNLMIGNFISSTYHIYIERSGTKILKTVYWFNMNYIGTDAPVPQIEEGITEAVWKNPQQIKSEVLPSTFKNIAFILEESGAIR